MLLIYFALFPPENNPFQQVFQGNLPYGIFPRHEKQRVRHLLFLALLRTVPHTIFKARLHL